MEKNIATRDACAQTAWKDHLARWGAYAAATGAALALSTGADAEIVYSGPQDVTVTGNGLKNITMAGKDLSFVQTVYHGTVIPSAGTAHVQAAVHGGIVVFAEGEAASLFAKGQAIGGTHTSYGGILRKKALLSGGTVSAIGHWGPGTVDEFMGVKISGDELGWIEVKVSDDGNGYPDEIQLLGWAYNDTPGGAINAGQTSDNTSATPEPGITALGLLASGAAGLLAWRKRVGQASACR